MMSPIQPMIPERSVNTPVPEASLTLAPKRRSVANPDEVAAWACRIVSAAAQAREDNHRVIECPNRHVNLPSPALERVEATLRDLSGELALLGVTGIGLFGSVARGDDTPESDVDVGVRMQSDGIWDHINDVGDLLEVHFNRPVDVIRLPFPFPLSTMAKGDLHMVW